MTEAYALKFLAEIVNDMVITVKSDKKLKQKTVEYLEKKKII